MKNISLFFKDKSNPSAIDNLTKKIDLIFGDYATITPYFLDELQEGQTIDADAHLVCYEEMLPFLSSHLTDFSKVVLVKYSMRKQNLESLKDIPVGEDVLVVNDSRESTLQTVYMLYEFGYNHIYLHPYIKDAETTKPYDSFEYCAVTNDALHLVPSTCRKIVNLQNRDISLDTYQKLMHVLSISNHDMQGKMLSKLESNSDISFNYVEDFLGTQLKGQLLTNIVENFSHGLVLIDRYTNVHYINEKGYEIFGVITGDSLLSSPNCQDRFFTGPDFKNKLITIGDSNYMAERQTLKVFNDVLGFCLILQDELTLRERETSFSRQLKSKGLYAKYTFKDIVYKSESMRRCIQLAKQAAPSDYTILLNGESGTGKELLAQSIHNYSLRATAPFVAVNCAALPESLLESELFGYEPGSFTGAQKGGKIGLFEQAQHGTIFLDEIGDISPNLQSRLLRVIQEKQVMRIGSDKIIDVDVRIVAATNADLEEKIKTGKFRADLFYRLNVINLNISPLRKRTEDILPLVKHFIGKSYESLSEKQKEILVSYPWPGNIRELENASSYYKLLGVFPEQLTQNTLVENIEPIAQKEEKDTKKVIHSRDYERIILSIIADSSKFGGGVGRSTICKFLEDQGCPLGEGKVKSLLKSLQDKGYIHSNIGRCGSQITQEGLSHLLDK